MPISVLDPDGRALHSIPAGKAAGKVNLRDAVWIHAPHIKPDYSHGTIQFCHPVEKPPSDDVKRTKVLDGDGVYLCSIWAPAAARVVAHDWATMIGTKSEAGYPRTILVPRLTKADPKVMNALIRIEAVKAVDAVAARDQLRYQINQALSTCTTWAELERRIEWLMQQCLYSPREISPTLAQLRILRQKLRQLDLALAPDMEHIRAQLVQPSITH